MDEKIKKIANLLAVARDNMNEANDEVEQLDRQLEKIVRKVDLACLDVENAERLFLEYCLPKD